MKENLTELVFILDRSGSMDHLTKDTIGGFNSFIQKQKEEPGEALVTLILFDNHYDVIYSGKDIQKVEPLTELQYYARGTTALLDAVGKTINEVGARLNNTAEEEKPSKVLFVITTDGYENSSVEFTKDKVKSMIEHQTEKYSWEFMFIGGDLESTEYFISMGANAHNVAYSKQDSSGVSALYCSINSAVTTYRSAGEINTDWKDELSN